ncbi:MAG: amino acid ABC transporter permease [Eubacterium sp.]|nr:amino acid ABC transporter permease [Eubacterium sp.]
MEIYINSFKNIVTGIPTTLSLTVISILLALALGVLISIGLLAKNRIIRGVCRFICAFLKGVPILVFLYMFNSAIDGIMGWFDTALPFYTYDIRKPPTFAFAVLGLALSYVPYMADMIITAMSTIPVGQFEACDAGGFTKWQKFSRIIIPQCIVIAIPNFGNHFVNLLKASSLTCMVTIMEMMGEARNFATMSQKFLECYIVCALTYWAVFVVFEQFFKVVERRFGRYLKAGVSVKKRKKFSFKFAKTSEKVVGEVS